MFFPINLHTLTLRHYGDAAKILRPDREPGLSMHVIFCARLDSVVALIRNPQASFCCSPWAPLGQYNSQNLACGILLVEKTGM